MLSLKAHRIISAWLRNPDKAEPQGFARHVALAQPLVDAGKFAAYLVQFPGKLNASLDIERSLAVLREGFAELPLAVELPTHLTPSLTRGSPRRCEPTTLRSCATTR